MLWALVFFTYLGLLEFGDGDYARSRLLDHIDGDRFDSAVALGFFVRACFRAIFFAACLGLSFALRFFGVALAPDFFVVVLRTDEVLRVLLRAIDFRFLAVARFFP